MPTRNGYRQKERHWIMTGKSKAKIAVVAVIILIAATVYFFKFYGKNNREELSLISPARGTIKTFISCTGTVQPQNRLEMKPPVDGRIEKILVKEGDRVSRGGILAWMSSKERAALIDSARAKGSGSYAYWRDVYKPIPLVAPINGMVIVRSVEPGQTVTSSTAVLVLSNRLIVQAEVDETDIGRVKRGQQTIITLDAYHNIKVAATVNHISFESTTVNNVTVYKVDIVPVKVPPVFRSGMSATVEIIENIKEDILILPLTAVRDEAGQKSVNVMVNGKIQRKNLETGISDDTNIEVIGLSPEDKIVVTQKKFNAASFKKSGNSNNPFSPFRGRKHKEKKK